MDVLLGNCGFLQAVIAGWSIIQVVVTTYSECAHVVSRLVQVVSVALEEASLSDVPKAEGFRARVMAFLGISKL